MIQPVAVMILGIGMFTFAWALSSLGRGRSRPHAKWALLQERYGIHVQRRGGYDEVEGVIDGISFAYTAADAWRDLSVRIERPLGDLVVRRENAPQSLGKKLRGDDIELGDPTFDDHWIVRCSDPKLARRVLKRSKRIAIHNTFADLGGRGDLVIEKNRLRWISQGVTAERMADAVRLLGKCKRVIEREKKKAPAVGEGD
jgi:hypothetical protein